MCAEEAAARSSTVVGVDGAVSVKGTKMTRGVVVLFNNAQD
jgi:hypothetical protein